MLRLGYRCLFVGLLTSVLVGSGRAESILKNPATGAVKLQTIQSLTFASDGVLLVADGTGSQVVAIDTGDTKLSPWQKSTEKLDEQLAAKLGTTSKNIEIVHLAVNPASGKAYLAVRKQDDKSHVIFTVDGEGKIGVLALDNVKHIVVSLPKTDKSAITRVTDLAVLSDRLIVSGASTEEFASKILSIPLPLDTTKKMQGISAETFHVAHNKWETKAPMTSLMTLEQEGKKYVVGAFACTPVVRYSLDQVTEENKIKGESVLEIGSGNQPRNMFQYSKEGKSYVLVHMFRFHHDRKPYGPSPYVVIRFDSSLLGEKEKINKDALLRLNNKGEPGTDKVKVVELFHGTEHMDKLDKDRALVIQKNEKTGLTLAALQLP